MTAASYAQLLRTAFGARAGEVAAEYPLSAYASPSLAWSAVVTDRLWARALDEQNRLLSAHTTVHAYEFADGEAPGVVEFPAGFPPGAHHSAEVFYQFDAAGTGEFEGTAGTFSAAQKEFAGQLNRYWATFARTGDPNAAGLPRWSPGEVLALAPGAIAPTDYAATHHLPFWTR